MEQKQPTNYQRILLNIVEKLKDEGFFKSKEDYETAKKNVMSDEISKIND